MNIGILGSGDVAFTLAGGLIEIVHSIKIGTRDPGQEKVVSWVLKHGTKASAGSPAEAASFGGIVVLATSWEGTLNVVNYPPLKVVGLFGSAPLLHCSRTRG